MRRATLDSSHFQMQNAIEFRKYEYSNLTGVHDLFQLPFIVYQTL